MELWYMILTAVKFKYGTTLFRVVIILISVGW